MRKRIIILLCMVLVFAVTVSLTSCEKDAADDIDNIENTEEKTEPVSAEQDTGLNEDSETDDIPNDDGEAPDENAADSGNGDTETGEQTENSDDAGETDSANEGDATESTDAEVEIIERPGYEAVVGEDGTVYYFPIIDDSMAQLIMGMSETEESSDTLPVPEDWEPIETEIDFFD